MSYIQYITLYTNKSTKTHNNHKVVKRGQKNNHWLHSLNVDDKLDIYDGQKKGDKCWHIGTVIKIEKNDNKQTKLLIHYDGWTNGEDEWVNIDDSTAISSKLKKLNTITPYHDYLGNPASIKPCKWTSSSQWKKCNVCDIKCCNKCFITNNDDKCKKCMKLINRQNLFNAIYSSIYDQYAIDINIIHVITEYSTGITIQCSNTNKSCLNDINFATQYKMERNLCRNDQDKTKVFIYQYCPKYIHQGSITIFGKNRRIFCEPCTKNELFYCSHCDSKEAKGCDISFGFCHNHHLIECVICKKEYDEGGVCRFCGNGHCTSCDGVYCGRCNRCKFSINIFQCQHCMKYICNECEKYNKYNLCGDCGLGSYQFIARCNKKWNKKEQDAIGQIEQKPSRKRKRRDCDNDSLLIAAPKRHKSINYYNFKIKTNWNEQYDAMNKSENERINDDDLELLHYLPEDMEINDNNNNDNDYDDDAIGDDLFDMMPHIEDDWTGNDDKPFGVDIDDNINNINNNDNTYGQEAKQQDINNDFGV